MGHLLLFDISGGELLLIMLVVLLFFGSKGLPGIARTLGRAMRQVQDASAEVQREIQRGATEVRQGYEDHRRSLVGDVSSTTPRRPTVEPPAEAPAPEPPPPPPGPPGAIPRND